MSHILSEVAFNILKESIDSSKPINENLEDYIKIVDHHIIDSSKTKFSEGCQNIDSSNDLNTHLNFWSIEKRYIVNLIVQNIELQKQVEKLTDELIELKNPKDEQPVNEIQPNIHNYFSPPIKIIGTHFF